MTTSQTVESRLRKYLYRTKITYASMKGKLAEDTEKTSTSQPDTDSRTDEADRIFIETKRDLLLLVLSFSSSSY